MGLGSASLSVEAGFAIGNSSGCAEGGTTVSTTQENEA